MSYTRVEEDALRETVRASRSDSGTRLSDQLEGVSALIDQLHVLVGEVEDVLSPILREDREASGGTGEDVAPNFSLMQRQVMGQYNSLNMLGNRLNSLRQRVTL